MAQKGISLVEIRTLIIQKFARKTRKPEHIVWIPVHPPPVGEPIILKRPSEKKSPKNNK